MLTLRRQTIDRPAAALEERARRRGLVAKRAFDIVVGTPLALAAIPVILVLAVAVAISLRTWPFFVQRRIGQYGREFWFPKLRTLPPSAPKYADKYEIADIRLTRLASLMRRTHLDELPQLLQVPIGTMSLVGPRPKMPDSVEPIDPAYGRLRVWVRQGCTGLWQVGEHIDRQVSESPAYDVFYLRHGSLRLDMWVLWRTAFALLGGGAVRIDCVPQWVRGRGFLQSGAAHGQINLDENESPALGKDKGLGGDNDDDDHDQSRL